MNSLNFPTSACRYCRYYQVEGRRGGMCQQLSVPVRGGWKACSLALPAFATSWKNLEAIWKKEATGIKGALAVNCSLASPDNDLNEEENFSTSAASDTADVVLL